jgi:hypothetical protein
MSRAIVNLIDRFVLKTKKSATGCIEWTAQTNHKGYGIFGAGPYVGERRAHRVSFRLFVGEIPNGLCVLHKCDNRRCVNPIHLFLGTHLDNARDCIAKGRWPKDRTFSNAKLTPADITVIRKRIANGDVLNSIAADFGVGPTAIQNIAHRRTWSNIP